jgi:hypothetical protein
MRRVVAVTIALCCVLGATAVSSAAVAGRRNVSGEFGMSVARLRERAGCSEPWLVQRGTANLAPYGNTKIRIVFCLPAVPLEAVPGAGSVVLSSAAGRMRGTVTTTLVDYDDPPFFYALAVRITGGTRRFAGARGELDVRGTFVVGEGGGGSVSGAVETPRRRLLAP